MKNIEYINDWFKDHKATYEEVKLDSGLVRKIIWKNPNSSNYALYYIEHNNTITITGDLGCSVFKNHNCNLEWLALSDLSYLREKLIACSETTGDKLGISWSYEIAEETVREVFKQRFDEMLEEEIVPEEEYKELEERLFEATSSYGEFYVALAENHRELYELFGSDWYEVINTNAGGEASIRLVAQLKGLNLALKELGKIK